MKHLFKYCFCFIVIITLSNHIAHGQAKNASNLKPLVAKGKMISCPHGKLHGKHRYLPPPPEFLNRARTHAKKSNIKVTYRVENLVKL